MSETPAIFKNDMVTINYNSRTATLGPLSTLVAPTPRKCIHRAVKKSGAELEDRAMPFGGSMAACAVGLFWEKSLPTATNHTTVVHVYFWKLFSVPSWSIKQR